MDAHRFDALTKGLASSQSRRRVLKALSGAGLSALFGLGGRDASADACKGEGKRCKKDSQCCSGICFPPSDSKSTAGSSSTCCAPEETTVTCAGTCDTQMINNCGQTVNCGPCCTPNCDGKTCGDDGCGGSCGSCPSDENCHDGECRHCTSDSDCGTGEMCTRDGCLPDPCYGYICPEGQWCWTKTYDTAVCVCPTGQVMCDGECVPGDCCSDGWCEDEIDCTTNLCDYGGLGCVFIRIGGGAGNGDLCEVGEFLSDGQKCDEMSGICDSQYCDPETDLCAPNPDGPCIKRGLPCDADVPCCFGLPCTRGYCWDGTL